MDDRVFTRTIDDTLYTRRALIQARNAYIEYYSVWASPDANGMLGVAVTVHPEFQQDARQVILEFWNFFLDTACEQGLNQISPDGQSRVQATEALCTVRHGLFATFPSGLTDDLAESVSILAR